MKSIRVGMVGTGFMARAHTLAYRNVTVGYRNRLPSIVTQCVADLTPELAAAGAARLGWNSATGDWTSITRADDIDMVDIVTPNDSHAEIAIDAARHGKHILCEKPLSVDPRSAREMYDAVIRAGVRHQVGFVYRQLPAAQFAKKLIAEGTLGDLLEFRGEYMHDYALDPELPISWRFQAEKAGAGAVADIGSHVIDMARYLVGEIARVTSRSQTLVTERHSQVPGGGEMATFSRPRRGDTTHSQSLVPVTVDDATQMLVEFDNGAVGIIECSRIAAGHKCELAFEVQGTLGSVRFNWLHPNELRYYSCLDPGDMSGFRTIVIGPMHPGGEELWPVAGLGIGYGDAFVIAIRTFLDSIQSGVAHPPTFFDGLMACEVIDAARRSAATLTWSDVTPASQITDGSGS